MDYFHQLFVKLIIEGMNFTNTDALFSRFFILFISLYSFHFFSFCDVTGISTTALIFFFTVAMGRVIKYVTVTR